MIQKSIDIWKDFNPSNSVVCRPRLTCYLIKRKKCIGAVVILPGGAYERISQRESEPVALRFTAAGYNAFVLDYSIRPQRFPKALQDICRSLTIIRQNAKDWKIDPDKIAVCGFSAGGHAAACLGVFWQRKELYNINGIDTDRVKPNALVLSYPVISSGEFAHKVSIKNLLGENPSNEILETVSLEKQVSSSTPPVFLWHTIEDQSVPVENSLLFASALRKHNVPFELHIYPRGAHGLALATNNTSTESIKPDGHVAGWLDLCIQWLKIQFKKF